MKNRNRTRMQRRLLPIGIQNLSKIRSDHCYYVDKTRYACQLVEQGGYFFLSRPRRFGKSLFLDTLKELFECNQALFTGLYAERHWDWSTPSPVIRISLGSGVVRSRAELDSVLEEHLRDNARRLGVTLSHTTISGRFAELIEHTAHTHGARAVVLIDEYDKPILDNLSDPERAIEAREGLKNLYSVLKDADPFLRFVLLTGVSKFSKVSLFSGLNNLNDITLDPRYSAICGYTDADVDTVFEPELDGLDRDEIRRWYNGYNWGGDAVYNPFDLLLLFQKRVFKPYWFETATPSFLVRLLAERGCFTPELNMLPSEEDLLGRFDVNDISTEALLFQTGYLTIARVEQPITGHWIYTLGYPNLEVETSLNRALLPVLGVPNGPRLRLTLLKVLQSADLALLEEHLKALFASIPHDWHRKNAIAHYEGYYASVFYSHFAALGVDVVVEDASSQGRVDMRVSHGEHVYLFEFKVVADAPEGKALQQIVDRGYADKHRTAGRQVHLIGVEFSAARRQIVAFETRAG